MSIVNTDIIINKKAQKSKSKKAIIMNPGNKFAKKEIQEHFEEEKPTQHFTGFIPEEIIANSKNLVIKGVSLIGKSRSDILYTKLASSKYVNAYLNNYMMMNVLGQLNDHVKMALVCGVCYLESVLLPVNTPEQTTKINETI